MNITLSAEEVVIERARVWAQSHGTSLNAVIREHLKSLAAETDLPQVALQFRQNALTGRPDSDYRFSREALYAGKRFGS
jgi:predicted ArsR family transcriptional regulator